MQFEDKYHLTKEENKRYAKSNLARLVFENTRFEGLSTSLPQTETIVSGLGVDGVPIDDINTIVQLKRGWQYIINEDSPLSLDIEKNINTIVARDDALYPGQFRSGSSLVSTYNGDYIPPKTINTENEKNYFNDLMNSNRSTTDKALTLMLHNMRQQIFWDGNKRSATLAANKLMIENGAGLIAVPVDKYPKFLKKISDYYFSNDMNDVKKWTYENGIQGINLDHERKIHQNNKPDPKLQQYLGQQGLDR